MQPPEDQERFRSQHTPLTDSLHQYEENIVYRTFAPDNQPWFQLDTGRIPVLLSAPHAAAHQRSGSTKMEEEFTAGFVRWLSAETGAHALYTTHRSPEDPNWDEHSAYKNALAAHAAQHDIRLILDLHGMTNRHNIGIALGTMNGQSYKQSLEMVQHCFLAEGFANIPLNQLAALSDQNWRRLVVNHPKFTGGLKSHTVTRFSAEILNIPAIQIEVTSAARIVHRGPNSGWPFDYYGDPQAITATLNALTALINCHI